MRARRLQSILLAAAQAVLALRSLAISAAVVPPVLEGTIYDEQGRLTRNADICLYRIDFQTIDAAQKYRFPQGAVRCRNTGLSGSYSLVLPDRAAYLLLARRKTAWVMRVVTPSSNADTLRRQDTLRPTGSLQFQVIAEGHNDHRAVVSLTGTPFSFTGDTTGMITVSGIPAGAYGGLIRSIHRGYRAVRCSLRIRSAETDRFPGTLTIPRESVAHVPQKEIIISSSPAAISAEASSPVHRHQELPVSMHAGPQTAVAPPQPKKPSPPDVHKPPYVNVPADTFIGIFDSLTLAGTASDDGAVVAMEWDIGACGKFLRTDDGRIQLPPFRAPVKRMLCIFRAIDNDGLSSVDTTTVYAGLLWKTITPPNELLGRNGHSFITFNDALFIVGGKRSDIWTSGDGSSWTLLADSAPFGKLFGHSTVVFKNRIWIIGGKTGPGTFSNAIWSSAAGVRWEREADMPFNRRLYHGAVVFQDKLWVIGGLSGSETEPILNDIWSSDNGKHWTLVAKHAPFQERYGHGCAVFNNRIVVLGGFNDAVGKQQSFNDIWQSSNGSDWTRITAEAPFSKEQYHSVITFDNRLWAIGGYEREDGAERFTDILFTGDCVAWVNLTPGISGKERFFCAAVAFRNRIMISPSDSHRIWIMR